MAEDRTQLVIETSSEAGSDAGLTESLEQLLDLQRQAKELDDDLDKLAATASDADGEFGQLGDGLGQTSEEARRAAEAAERLRDRLDQMDRQLGSAAAGTKKLREGLKNIGAKAFSGAIDAARESLIGFQRRLGELALEKIVDGLKAGAVAVVDFDQAMARVQTNTGATGESLQRLEQLARDLGSTTDRTATEVASGFFEMSKAGFSAAEIIASGEATVRLAQVAFVDMGEAAGRAATQVRAFGGEAADLRTLVDQAALGATSANLTFAEMDTALTKVAPTAVLVNKALGEQAKSASDVQKEMIPLVAVLADAGIRGATAGEGIDRLIRRLQVLADGSDKSKAELERLGLSFDDVNPAVVGTTQALENLAAAQLEPQSGFRLVGDEAARVFNVLTQGVPAIREAAAAQENAAGSAARLAAGYQDNLRGAYDAMISAATELALVVGDTSATEAARTSMKILTDFMAENEEAAKALGVVFGGLGVAINTIALALTKGFTIALDAVETSVHAFSAAIGAAMVVASEAVSLFSEESAESMRMFGESLVETSSRQMKESMHDLGVAAKEGGATARRIFGEDLPGVLGVTGEAAGKMAADFDAASRSVTEKAEKAKEAAQAVEELGEATERAGTDAEDAGQKLLDLSVAALDLAQGVEEGFKNLESAAAFDVFAAESREAINAVIEDFDRIGEEVPVRLVDALAQVSGASDVLPEKFGINLDSMRDKALEASVGIKAALAEGFESPEHMQRFKDDAANLVEDLLVEFGRIGVEAPEHLQQLGEELGALPPKLAMVRDAAAEMTEGLPTADGKAADGVRQFAAEITAAARSLTEVTPEAAERFEAFTDQLIAQAQAAGVSVPASIAAIRDELGITAQAATEAAETITDALSGLGSVDITSGEDVEQFFADMINKSDETREAFAALDQASRQTFTILSGNLVAAAESGTLTAEELANVEEKMVQLIESSTGAASSSSQYAAAMDAIRNAGQGAADGTAAAGDAAAATQLVYNETTKTLEQVAVKATEASEAMRTQGAQEGADAMDRARDAAEGASEAFEGAGGSFEDAADTATEAAEGMGDVADAAEGAAEGQEAIGDAAQKAMLPVSELYVIMGQMSQLDFSGLTANFFTMAGAVAALKEEVVALTGSLDAATQSAWALAEASEAAAPSGGGGGGEGGGEG